jgi:hypothetical protein
MAQKLVREAGARENPRRRFLLYILPALPPVALLAAYYITRADMSAAGWVEASISAPVRSFLARVTSFAVLREFSLAEALITLCIIWVLVYLVRTVYLAVKRPDKLSLIARRSFVLLLAALWFYTLFSWSWGIGYRGASLSQESGIGGGGVSVEQLERVTATFAGQANALSSQVSRDSGGHYNESLDTVFSLSKSVYGNISRQIPALGGQAAQPKPMLYSKLMSAVGFTGFYFGLTGETNINIDAPAVLIPATVAHEMAHQRGVHSEDEANFAAIAACTTSGIPVYAYSGYLDGLIYLSNALNEVSPDAAGSIMSTLNKDVVRDLNDDSAYWARFQSPATDAVTAMYDGYLKDNGQTLGVRSYGACVDMLVTWLTA